MPDSIRTCLEIADSAHEICLTLKPASGHGHWLRPQIEPVIDQRSGPTFSMTALANPVQQRALQSLQSITPA